MAMNFLAFRLKHTPLPKLRHSGTTGKLRSCKNVLARCSLDSSSSSFYFNSRVKPKPLRHPTIQENRCVILITLLKWHHVTICYEPLQSCILHTSLNINIAKATYPSTHPPKKYRGKRKKEKFGRKKKKVLGCSKCIYVNYFPPLSHVINSFESGDKFIILNTKTFQKAVHTEQGKRRTQISLEPEGSLLIIPSSHLTAEKTEAYVLR